MNFIFLLTIYKGKRMNRNLEDLISSPHFQGGHLSSLVLMLLDREIVNLMKCTKKLYNREYPLISLNQICYSWNEIKNYNIIPKITKLKWFHERPDVKPHFLKKIIKNIKELIVENGLNHIVKELENNKIIKYIRIHSANSEDIIKILKSNLTIETLNLDFSNLKSDDFAEIFDNMLESKINTLLLCNNIIGIKGMNSLIPLLNLLTHVDLGYNSISDIKLLAYALQTNKSIKILELPGNTLGDNNSKYLFHCLENNNTIEKLNMGNNWMYKFESKLNDNLKVLSLSFNLITDIEWFCQTPNKLTELHLVSNSINSEGSLHISKLISISQSLTNIDISYTNMKDISFIAKALCYNIGIIKLGLSGNRITNIESLLWTLKLNNTLKYIDLSYNCIVDNLVFLNPTLKLNKSIISINLKYNPINFSLENPRILQSF